MTYNETKSQDYISTMAKDIEKKLGRLLKRKHQADDIKQSLQETDNLVQSCLQLSGDLGEIFHFSHEYSKFNSMEDFVSGVFNLLSAYRLKVVIRITSQSEVIYAANSGRVSELDKQIMEDKISDQRFVEFGIRVQVNFPRISLLIKNMPKKDNHQYTRIKDNLIYLLSMSDNLLSLYDSRKMKEFLLYEVNHSMEIAEKMTEQAYTSHMLVINELDSSLEHAYLSMGLSDQQEEMITDLVMKADRSTEDLYGLSNISNKILAELREKIEKSYKY